MRSGVATGTLATRRVELIVAQSRRSEARQSRSISTTATRSIWPDATSARSRCMTGRAEMVSALTPPSS